MFSLARFAVHVVACRLCDETPKHCAMSIKLQSRACVHLGQSNSSQTFFSTDGSAGHHLNVSRAPGVTARRQNLPVQHSSLKAGETQALIGVKEVKFGCKDSTVC